MRLHACTPFPSVTMFAPQHMLQISGDSCNDHWAGNDHMRCRAAPAATCCHPIALHVLNITTGWQIRCLDWREAMITHGAGPRQLHAGGHVQIWTF